MKKIVKVKALVENDLVATIENKVEEALNCSYPHEYDREEAAMIAIMKAVGYKSGFFDSKLYRTRGKDTGALILDKYGVQVWVVYENHYNYIDCIGLTDDEFERVKAFYDFWRV